MTDSFHFPGDTEVQAAIKTAASVGAEPVCITSSGHIYDVGSAVDATHYSLTPDQLVELVRAVRPSDAMSAVISAAREWSSERSISDWCEADLMKAVVILDGDWLGCDECDHQCDEPCMPATAEQMLRSVDNHIAQLVHDGKLGAYVGYEPPKGFVPKARTGGAA